MGRHRLVVIAVLTLTVACSGPTVGSNTSGSSAADPASSAGSTAGPSREFADLEYRPVDLGTAVTQLGDPATAVNGVLGVLDALGIGVYTSDGVQVLAGSETGPDDFWVLAELLPGIAASASRPGPTMDHYLATLDTELGTGLEPAELAAVYAVMVGSLPDYGMSRVIDALGIDFAPDGRLTRFEAWLLMLAWLPANGSEPVSSTAPRQVLALAPVAAPIRCGPTGEGGNDPKYSLAEKYGKGAADGVGDEVRDAIADGALGRWAGTTGSAAEVATALQNIGKWVIKPLSTLKDAAEAFQVAANFDVAVDTDPVSTHEVHDSQGETKEKKRSQITVTVTFLGASVSHPDDCKLVALLGLPDPNTPIEDAQVAIVLDDDLARHGTVRRRGDQNSARAGTDAEGQVVVWYEPDYERPRTAQGLGDAFLHNVHGTYTVTVNVTAAMGQLFNVFSGWEFVLDLMGLNEIDGEITVGWHDPAASVTITEPLVGWAGTRQIHLETCDGVNWSGSVEGRGTMTSNGATLTQVIDSPMSVIVPEGSSTGTSPVLIDSTVTGTVEGGTMENLMTQTGELTLSLDQAGTATVELALDQGTQDITVSAQGMTVHRSGVIEPETRSWTQTVEPAQCEE